MLVNLRDICAVAEQHSIAVASFNTPSFEAVRAAVEAAEETGFPVILSHAQGHEEIAPLEWIGPMMVEAAERSSALVCVHLDHCEDLSYMRKALDLGFSGAMYDGSFLPYDENVSNSKRAARMVANYDCGLECELGSMGTRENGAGHENDHVGQATYTDPDQAAEFIEETGLDILACTFGTVHGIYKGEPHLNYDVLREIRNRVDVPLVMHGGSGVSDADYQRCVEAGIRKVNYFTYGAKFAGEAVRKLIKDFEAKDSGSIVYWQDMTTVAHETLFEDFKHVINVLSNGQAPVA